ncbi:MAG: large-conductance mechanosensitive channel protein MscL [Clostridia bacterium]|nr:large-conductance mechanosensitive channel protein MscL [Clostridia bacterium]
MAEEKKGFFKEFKEFITKGNILDMAVGVVVGGAFGKIVTSLVNDIVMPPIGMAIGGVDFANLKAVIQPAVLDEAGEVVKEAVSINYGNFIQTIIEFIIIALCIFLVLRGIIKAKALAEKAKKEKEAEPAPEPEPEPAPEPEPSEEVLLLREIRDSLKK